MLKERYNKAFDRVNATQTLIEQTKREVYEMANQKQMRRARFSAALIAAFLHGPPRHPPPETHHPRHVRR